MLETVVAIASLAVYAGRERRPDDRLAHWARAWLLRYLVVQHLALSDGRSRKLSLAPALSPSTFLGAFVGSFGTVIQTEGV